MALPVYSRRHTITPYFITSPRSKWLMFCMAYLAMRIFSAREAERIEGSSAIADDLSMWLVLFVLTTQVGGQETPDLGQTLIRANELRERGDSGGAEAVCRQLLEDTRFLKGAESELRSRPQLSRRSSLRPRKAGRSCAGSQRGPADSGSVVRFR